MHSQTGVLNWYNMHQDDQINTCIMYTFTCIAEIKNTIARHLTSCPQPCFK